GCVAPLPQTPVGRKSPYIRVLSCGFPTGIGAQEPSVFPPWTPQILYACVPRTRGLASFFPKRSRARRQAPCCTFRPRLFPGLQIGRPILFPSGWIPRHLQLCLFRTGVLGLCDSFPVLWCFERLDPPVGLDTGLSAPVLSQQDLGGGRIRSSQESSDVL